MCNLIEKGLSCTSKLHVAEQHLASAAGSGDLPVLSTPAMIALMENAALNAVKDKLPESSTTVGTSVHISHDKATPLGREITAKAILTKVDGRKLTFEVFAYDADNLIGKGTHTRYIVDRDRFLAKL